MATRTNKPRTRKAHSERPAIAIGHVVLHVADTKFAAKFYERLGLRPIRRRANLAILELRGGTHLLLFPTRKRRAGRAAPFDLMADDLDASRARAVEHDLAPSAIEDDERSGHRFFTVRDPDGHRLTVYSSHTERRRV